MTLKIKLQTLERRVKLLNELTGSPPRPFIEVARGQYRPEVGNYHLDFVRGGVRLVRVHNDAGAVKGVFDLSYRSKAELHHMIVAMMHGWECREDDYIAGGHLDARDARLKLVAALAGIAALVDTGKNTPTRKAALDKIREVALEAVKQTEVGDET